MNPKIPEAFRLLPDSATLKAQDMCNIYGCTKTNLENLIRHGKIPRHDMTQREINAKAREARRDAPGFKSRSNWRYWRLGDIRAHVAKLQSEAKQ